MLGVIDQSGARTGHQWLHSTAFTKLLKPSFCSRTLWWLYVLGMGRPWFFSGHLTHIQSGWWCLEKQATFNQGTVHQGTNLKLPSLLKIYLILSLPINLINTWAEEKRGQSMSEDATYFLLGLKQQCRRIEILSIFNLNTMAFTVFLSEWSFSKNKIR